MRLSGPSTTSGTCCSCSLPDTVGCGQHWHSWHVVRLRPRHHAALAVHSVGRRGAATYLLGAHEQQVLHGVRYARHVLGVAEAPHVDVHGRAGLVRGGIVDQQHLELVRQRDDAVRAVVDLGALQVLDARPCNALSQWLRHVDRLQCSARQRREEPRGVVAGRGGGLQRREVIYAASVGASGGRCVA
jgi:hypothetical protein